MANSEKSNKISLKSHAQMALMRRSGQLVSEALAMCRSMAVPGCSLINLDTAVEQHFVSHGAQPLFKGYPGKVPYPGSTCLSVNEQVVHGLPGPRILQEGDLLKIDTACRLDGWCADAAITIPVGAISSAKERLCRVTGEVLQLAIRELVAGLRRRGLWSEVARKMQLHAEASGFKMVTQYVGHGIGQSMHEAPQVPNYYDRETVEHDFRLVPGLVLAVEPMVNMGVAQTRVLRDHWTVVTRDGLPSAHVEHTVALMADGVWVITADRDDEIVT